MYSRMPFAMALCSVEVPYNFVQTILFSGIAYFMIYFIVDAGPLPTQKPSACLNLLDFTRGGYFVMS